LAALCVSAHADDAGTPTYTYGKDSISVIAGIVFPDKGIATTGSGATVSGIYGYQFAPHFLAEANAQSSSFDTRPFVGIDYQNGVTFDLVYQLRDRSAGLFTPFILAGAGAVYDDFYPNSRDGVAVTFEAGAGLISAPLFHRGVRLRVEGRYVHEQRENGHDEPRVLLGLDFPLGRVEHRIEYLPAKVEVREVPVVRSVPAPPTPAVTLRDSDGDGVDDSHDLCPDTPRGMRVDATGCAVADQVFTLEGVYFAFNDARITRNAALLLDRISLAFLGQPSLRAEIAGHTDSVGSQASNQNLSQRRAAAVRDYLIQRGARPDQLIARGYGKSQLLVDPEHGDADAERNRRVELRVLAR
jgi:OOP family OmpA-OmpF porin